VFHGVPKCEDGQRIGRIGYAKERAPGIWLWNVTVPGPPFGDARSIGEAKERFKTAWLALQAARIGSDALAAAYEAMNHANRPGRYGLDASRATRVCDGYTYLRLMLKSIEEDRSICSKTFSSRKKSGEVAMARCGPRLVVDEMHTRQAVMYEIELLFRATKFLCGFILFALSGRVHIPSMPPEAKVTSHQVLNLNVPMHGKSTAEDEPPRKRMKSTVMEQSNV
jgi:hypothetical protein